MFKENLYPALRHYLPVWFIVIRAWRTQRTNTVVLPSLSAHCLKMAVMPEEELAQKVRHPSGRDKSGGSGSAREQHGENKLPHNNRRRGGLFMGLLSQPI